MAHGGYPKPDMDRSFDTRLLGLVRIKRRILEVGFQGLMPARKKRFVGYRHELVGRLCIRYRLWRRSNDACYVVGSSR